MTLIRHLFVYACEK